MDDNSNQMPLNRLFGHVCKLHYIRTRGLLEPLGIYRGQPPMLFFLLEHPGSTQTELANALQVQPATVTKMLQRMENTGFVERKPDPEDQRVSRVYLTQAGKAIQDEMSKKLKALEAETFAGFSLEERVLLKRFFVQMSDNLLKVLPEKIGHCHK